MSRLAVEGAGWQLRGGVVGDEVRWRRGDDEHVVRAHGFTGSSPAYAIAVAGLGPGRRRLVLVSEPALATRTVELDWSDLGEGAWRVDDPATGERSLLELSEQVVLAGPGLRLADLDMAVTESDHQDWLL